MSEQHGSDIYLRDEQLMAESPFAFSISPEELKRVVQNSELAKPPLESSSADQSENLYEQRGASIISISHKELSAVQRISNGEFTGKLLAPSEVVLMLGEEIGAGATGKVYLCRNIRGAGSGEDNLVVKVCISNQDYNQDHEQNHLVKIIKSEAEALKLHNDDDPPVIPKFFGSGEIDGHPAYAMELMRDPTIDKRLSKNGLFPIKEALGAIFPFLNLLTVEERHGRTASDFKTENIRVAKNPKGEEYFRYLDYGLVPMSEFGQKDIRFAIARMAGFVYSTVKGRNPGPDTKEKMSLLPYWKLNMDMIKHQEFKSLPIGFQAIIMKGLGFLDGGYNTFKDINLDLALLDRSLRKNIARVELPDYQPSDLIKRAIAASVDTIETPLPKKKALLFQFKKPIIEPPVNKREQLVGEMGKMLFAARPPEVIESEGEKRNRLIKWKGDGGPLRLLHGTIANRRVNEDTMERFYEYLSIIPDDPDMIVWKDLLEAMQTIDKSGIREKDSEFGDYYPDYLDSLVADKKGREEILPIDQLKVSARPLIELADKLKAITKVSDSKENAPELSVQELMTTFLDSGLAIDGLKSKSPTGNLGDLDGFKRQSGLDFAKRAIDALDALEKQGVELINVAGRKIPIGQIRARVEKDLQDLSVL